MLTAGVEPSLHFDYKQTRVKQYFKLGRALRTETTVNNTRDFAVGKLLRNLEKIKAIGFQANRRRLSLQRLSHDCTVGADRIERFRAPACGSQSVGCAFRVPRCPNLTQSGLRLHK